LASRLPLVFGRATGEWKCRLRPTSEQRGSTGEVPQPLRPRSSNGQPQGCNVTSWLVQRIQARSLPGPPGFALRNRVCGHRRVVCEAQPEVAPCELSFSPVKASAQETPVSCAATSRPVSSEIPGPLRRPGLALGSRSDTLGRDRVSSETVRESTRTLTPLGARYAVNRLVL
jgi:hypothetical protein